MDFDFDLFVIGGGSGGVRAARIAASEGRARVARAEESRMGGTCVIRGCVPKKLMVYASEYPGLMQDARAYGWQVQSAAFDWAQFQGQLEAELTRLEGAYRSGLTGAGVTILDQRARLIDAHRVELADGRQITAAHILIATGGRPFIPDIPGAELGITSNEIFHLKALPKRALVVGGGYIASEFACILNGLGVKVTQSYRGAQILRGFDEECRAHIVAAMQASGIDLRLNSDVMALHQGADGITAQMTGGAGQFDLVLCRNMLMYLCDDRRRDVLENLANATAPDGYLMLGAAETVIGQTSRFEASREFRGFYERSKAVPSGALNLQVSRRS